MPWVTAAERADVLVTGAALDDGRQLLIALPTDRPGLTVRPAFPWPPSRRRARPRSSAWCRWTTRICWSGPSPDVIATPGAAGTGGLETSALALGQARAALAALIAEAPRRDDLVEPVEALAEAWNQHWSGVDGRRARDEPDALPPGQVRGQANALVAPAHPGVPDGPQGDRLPPHRTRPALGAAGPLLPRLVLPGPVAQAASATSPASARREANRTDPLAFLRDAACRRSDALLSSDGPPSSRRRCRWPAPRRRWCLKMRHGPLG